jgi:putative ABC transport system permease protein
MIQPRWRKVLHDLWDNKTRSLLVILTIAVGVFAVGTVSSTFTILLGDMNADYRSINPSSVAIYTSPFGDNLLEIVVKMPEVAAVEGRTSLSTKLVQPGEKFPVNLVGIPPIDEIDIDRLRLERGRDVRRGEHEILIERTVLQTLDVALGDTLTLELLDGGTRQVRVVGVVHDLNNAPLAFSGVLSAYTDRDTLVWLGGQEKYTQLNLLVAEREMDEAYIKEVGQRVSERIEASGYEAYGTFALTPGRHWASDITAGLGIFMIFLGAMAVFLSGFLVVNTINSLLSQQFSLWS